ncbi:serine--tRNA ligase [candidate division WOR-3 bacterium]|nr:serine--tRNA ligase [candidate division WOR-3 bacterium]TET78887.1 MAG: serine--tRNA ligase [Candidatus Cloacimonadota bacterium]
MVDLRFVRENIERVKEAVKNKNENVDIDRLLSLDSKHRNLQKELDSLRHIRNKVSKEISLSKRNGENEPEKIEKMRKVSQDIKKLEREERKINGAIDELLIWIPNIPHSSVPIGKDSSSNTIVRETPEEKLSFIALSHWQLTETNKLLDYGRGAKVSGANFPCYTGIGARLERALINFMLDTHVSRGYKEVFTPFLVNRNAMFATGQLPKLEDDMYLVEKDDMFLNPTAEVPITNLHRDEIIKEEDLPLKYVGYTACFRREAGSYGRETKGLQRVHQFNKVELVKIVDPSTSYEELETLTKDAEIILSLLELPYRVTLLSTGDLSFASAKTYDLEVWAPGSEKFFEVSSASNFEDFQARRANIKMRKAGKLVYAHTLNASGIATPRTFIAIIENYQQEDGTIRIPSALIPYMGGLEKIEVNA